MTQQELQALRDALVASLGKPATIETPQLGRVEYRDSADVAAALATLDREIAAASGSEPYGVFTIE